MENSANVITIITYLLFLFLIIAIFVERTVEIFVSIVKYVDQKREWYKIWNRRAEQVRSRLDRVYKYQGSDTDDKKRLFSWILWQVVTEKPYNGGKEIIAARSIRTRFYRLASRVFAFIFSLIFAIWIYRVLNIDLVSILGKVSGYEVGFFGSSGSWVSALKIFLTAALLSAGSEPLHQLIRKVEQVGQSKKKENS